MSLIGALLLKHQNHKPSLLPSLLRRALASSAEPQTQKHQTAKPPLSLLFQEAAGTREPAEKECENEPNEVKRKLLELERELTSLRRSRRRRSRTTMGLKADNTTRVEEEESKKGVSNKEGERPKNLFSVFTGKIAAERKKVVEPKTFKELSPEMEMLVKHLYREGYFNNASFLKEGRLDYSRFEDYYGREFIKFAAENFAKDHLDIAKWLSGSELKKVALFGCPSLNRKNVFYAKRLRKYFGIEEATVCKKCVLEHSCKFANQRVWRTDSNVLNLAVVVRILTQYALEDVDQEISIPDEIKASVNRSLSEVLKLSKAIT